MKNLLLKFRNRNSQRGYICIFTLRRKHTQHLVKPTTTQTSDEKVSVRSPQCFPPQWPRTRKVRCESSFFLFPCEACMKQDWDVSRTFELRETSTWEQPVPFYLKEVPNFSKNNQFRSRGKTAVSKSYIVSQSYSGLLSFTPDCKTFSMQSGRFCQSRHKIQGGVSHSDKQENFDSKLRIKIVCRSLQRERSIITSRSSHRFLPPFVTNRHKSVDLKVHHS